MSLLKELRIQKNLTQRQAAERLGVSLRSYVSYENDPARAETVKGRFLRAELEKLDVLDEEHGILTQRQISEACARGFAGYQVRFCWLFGSYAKGTAGEKSDVDLLVSCGETGLRFYEMAERLREALHKKVDLLNTSQLAGNEALLEEVLATGVRIYG